MKRVVFGTPEACVPSAYCKNFNYIETDVKYPFDKISFRETSMGCVIELPYDADAFYYGFGLQLKGFDFKGKKVTVRPNADPVAATGDSHAPVPFFVSTKGYGVYVDTARYAEFHMGVQKKDSKSVKTASVTADNTDDLYNNSNNAGELVISIFIPYAKGASLYFFEGKTITDVVSEYNMLSGGGASVPEWGLGVLYRCYTASNQDKIIETAKYFREKDMPCHILGLEPGWQTHAYSCTYVWNEELYPDREKMFSELRKMGYHVNLWEHAYVYPDSPIYDEIAEYSGDYKVWGGYVPDFTLDKAKDIFASYHRDNVANDIIDGFKLDECDGSDYTGGWAFPNSTEFPGGIDGMQYHNLFGVLYQQTIMDALDGRPTLSEVRNSGALAASYPFVLYSDLYDHRDFIRGCATSGFSGLLWAPELRDARNKRDLLLRLQTVVFSPHCLINGWYCVELPWLDHDCEDEVRYWLRVREQIMPRLKKAFDTYRDTGKPPVRALVSDYTDDPETYGADLEYLFCDDMLVVPVTATMETVSYYLPKGKWRNFFTGEVRQGGRYTDGADSIIVYEKV